MEVPFDNITVAKLRGRRSPRRTPDPPYGGKSNGVIGSVFDAAINAEHAASDAPAPAQAFRIR
jgi:hypothetical protein